MRAMAPDGAFRQPFPPQVRIRMSPQQAWSSSQGQMAARQPTDVQMRMAGLQQQQMQGQNRYQVRGGSMAVPTSSANNPLDPYDHIVKQRAVQQMQQGKGQGTSQIYLQSVGSAIY